MLKPRHLLGIALLWLITMVATPLLDDKVLVEQRATKLVIFNNTADSLYFTVIEARKSRFTKWQPCDHPGLCGDGGIHPAMSDDLPYELISGYYPGADIAVFWWHLVPDSNGRNGYRVEGPNKIVVPTPPRPFFGDG